MRSTTAFVVLFLTAGLVFAQEPRPEPIPVPPAPDPPGAVSAPTPALPPPTVPAPVQRRQRRTATAQAADAWAAQSFDQLADMDALLDDAAAATGLDRDTLRPAVEALKGTFPQVSRAVTTTVPGGSQGGQGHLARPRVYGVSREDLEKADRRLAEAIAALPEAQREAFAGWAAAKREKVRAAGARSWYDVSARESLASLLAGQRQLEAARLELEAQGPALEAERKALAQAQSALSAQQARLADEMSALARTRIEGALDKPLIERYRDLATTVDAARARQVVEELRRFAEAQPHGQGLEKQIEDLHAQRQAIDSAIERATTALVRERAEKLHLEARMRDEASRLVEAAGNPVNRPAPSPAAQPGAPTSPRQPTPLAAPAGEEIRLLREELRKLREEVEALRKRSDGERK
jgi:hypothetical protein